MYNNSTPNTPYGRDILDTMFTNAHTTNTFAPQPVDPDVIAAVYHDIRWAPTQMNAQPLRLTVVTTDDARQRLAPHMRPGNRAKTLAAPITIITAWDPQWHQHLPVLAPFREGATQKLDGDPTARSNIGQLSAHIQIGYLIVGLRAHGLHVGPMMGFNADGVDEAFHTDTGWKSIVVINAGWQPNIEDPKAIHPRAGRLHFDDACQII